MFLGPYDAEDLALVEVARKIAYACDTAGLPSNDARRVIQVSKKTQKKWLQRGAVRRNTIYILGCRVVDKPHYKLIGCSYIGLSIVGQRDMEWVRTAIHLKQSTRRETKMTRDQTINALRAIGI